MRRYALIILVSCAVSGAVASQSLPGASTISGLGFGGAVAVGNQEVFVGSAPVGWPRGAEPAGTVYRYVRRSGGSWVEADRMQASDGSVGDNFGRSIFAGESLLAIGAPGADAAYVFERDGSGAWREIARLSPSVLDEGAEFGGAYMRGGNRTSAIVIAGGKVAVTSYSADAESGAVHIFARADRGWTEEAILRPETGVDASGFGYAIAASEDRIFVGAMQENEALGAVHVFVNDGVGAWRRESRIVLNSESARALFGRSLTFSAGRLYAAAPAYEGAGAVFGFERDVANWIQVIHFSAPEAEEGQRRRFGFGNAVAVWGSTLFISSAGAVLVQDADDTSAVPMAIEPQDDHSRPSFGTGLAVSGDVAVIGSPGADYEEGIATVYEKSGSDEWTPADKLISDVSFMDAISGAEVRCENGTAAAFDCANVDLISFLPVDELSSERGVKMTDIWGWEDPETGKEWVLQARTDGVSFVDISDPYHPLFVGELMRTEGSPGSSWRDVKVYKDHAFVVADGAREHGVQIFDLRQLREVDPADMPVEFEETAVYKGVHSTHNIAINEETGFAFAVGNGSGGETCNGQLHMIDIRDPANPKFAGCYAHESARGTHDTQCVVYRGADSDYTGREICLSSNGSSFVIADVTDKENPVSLAITDYPNVNYTHQGWLSEDHNYFFMNDELDELNGAVDGTRTLIWDVRDLEDPTLVREFILDSKASDHNLYVQGNFMYQSNYQAGLRVLDITDPENPVEVGRFDTTPYGDDAPGFGGTWSNYPYFKSGIIATGSRGEGLFLLRKSEPGL